jgi:hypothetical protein
MRYNFRHKPGTKLLSKILKSSYIYDLGPFLGKARVNSRSQGLAVIAAVKIIALTVISKNERARFRLETGLTVVEKSS